MAEESDFELRKRVSDLLVARAAEHGTLLETDEVALRSVRSRLRTVAPNEDIVHEGDRPDTAVLLVNGMLARYQTLPGGERQYLSLHLPGDMPDLQSLFLDVMDHALCALDRAEVALMPHTQLSKLVLERPAIAFAFWRMTLVDAAIFRQAITNNGARSHSARLAHLFCEQLFRSKEAGLAEGRTCSLPLTQNQLGQLLGMSQISVNRALHKLREQGLVELRFGRLTVIDWAALVAHAGFDPAYLHVAKQGVLPRTPFGKRHG